MHETELNRWRITLAQRLESLARSGVTHIHKSRATRCQLPVAERQMEPATTWPSPPPMVQSQGIDSGLQPQAVRPQPPAPSTKTPASGLQPAGADTLEIVRRDVAACTRCGELVRNRTQTVFGVGNPHARLVFCGEAPGADEDRRGEPFVGAAGQLLNKILAACGFQRDEVYILNICKCRPPGNRTPFPEEAANCRPFLDRQLALIRPQFICCLGACAAHNLLNTTTPIGKLRQRVFESHGAHVVCTYHPAYLLRNPPVKRETWEDMKLLLKLMGLPIPQHGQ